MSQPRRTKPRQWPLILGLLIMAGVLHPHPVGAGELAKAFVPGEVWRDTEGNPIDAHGGGVLRFARVYYWYGENRGGDDLGAVACYSSTNLLAWKRAGVVLPRASLPLINGRRTFLERPKVIYNPRTKKFVMWMHLEQGRYLFSRAGI